MERGCECFMPCVKNGWIDGISHYVSRGTFKIRKCTTVVAFYSIQKLANNLKYYFSNKRIRLHQVFSIINPRVFSSLSKRLCQTKMSHCHSLRRPHKQFLFVTKLYNFFQNIKKCFNFRIESRTI